MTYVATDLSGPAQPRRAIEQPLPRARMTAQADTPMMTGNPVLNRVNGGATRSNKTPLLVGGAVAALLVIGGGSWFALQRPAPARTVAPVAAAPLVNSSASAEPVIKPAAATPAPRAATSTKSVVRATPASAPSTRVAVTSRKAAPVARVAPAKVDASPVVSAAPVASAPVIAPVQAQPAPDLSTFKLTPPPAEAVTPTATPAEAPQA